MAEIKLLADNMINKIAAGEVVERPASVVKELVENSIDAKSTAITIETAVGGKSLIRITDNGVGIDRNFVKTAFLRHATSKIEDIDDLENVATLGFRGEALSSISSVSMVKLLTKTKDDEMGYQIELEGGKVVDEKQVGALVGTSFIVENLFFNVPARLKFLKKTSIESSYITEIVNKFVIGHPEIAFRYINNSTTLIESNGNGNLRQVIYKIYGKNVERNLLELNYKDKLCQLNGFICKGEEYRSNRGYCNFYINGRYIKSQIMQKAVEDAYRGFLPIGKFPIFVINLQINPKEIDVNVHPTKLEVRFSDEDFIYDSIFSAINITFKPEILIPKKELLPEKKVIEEEEIKYYEEKLVEKDSFLENVETSFKVSDVATSFTEKEKPAPKIYEQLPQSNTPTDIYIKPEINNIFEKRERRFFKNYKIVGQIFDTYWIIESDGTSYIIDQHSAHEKVMYEEFMGKFKNDCVNSQTLLMPISLILNEQEAEIVNENLELFNKFGFVLEVFGKDTFAIRGVPFVFSTVNSSAFFMDILENLKVVGHKFDGIHEAFSSKIISLSCKAAVKANNKLTVDEAKALIEQLVTLENPFNCPHGRPTIIEFSKYEIEKLFKRKL